MPGAGSRHLYTLGALLLAAGCYETHTRPGDEPQAVPETPEPSLRPRGDTRLRPPEPRNFPRPNLPPIECTVEPTPDCTGSFPRIMIVMDASSSMLGGRSRGGNNWDKARFALAGDADSAAVPDAGVIAPAFARELEVRGNLVTIEDVIHLGMTAFNAADTQRLMLQYTPCAIDNLAWAMDPYTSCERPGCIDPYQGEPEWTFKNSDIDRDPPFLQTTRSYMPPCNSGGVIECIGTVYNTYTAEGLQAALDNLLAYRRDPLGEGLDAATRFANILITDGETSPDSPPEQVLEELAQAGAPTYVIGLAPSGLARDSVARLDTLDRYARAGGTRLATLVEATQGNIADAFAQAVTRVIDDLGTDPCCQPHHCRENPEPEAP